jgi:hypothetical protein
LNKPILLSGDHTPLNMEWYYSENTALPFLCSPPYAYNRLGWTEMYCYWCKYWVVLNPGLDGVGSNMYFHYCPWTGSIKPSLQYFHICRVRWLSKFPCHLL